MFTLTIVELENKEIFTLITTFDYKDLEYRTIAIRSCGGFVTTNTGTGKNPVLTTCAKNSLEAVDLMTRLLDIEKEKK